MPEVTSYDPGAPCWVDLATSDPDATRSFYGTLFGWEYEIGPAETMYYSQALVRGKPVAAIYGQPPGQGAMPVAWTTYLATDNADATSKRITDSGGALNMGPDDVMDQGRMVIATDPSGAVFGLWQAGKFFGAALVSEPGAFSWNELSTPDLDAARRFYSAVFGYEWEDVDTGPGGPPYATFAVGGRPVGGAMQQSDVPPNWGTYFSVADPDATVAKAQELGGGVLMPATDSPYGRFAVLRDPQGAVFSVTRLPDQP